MTNHISRNFLKQRGEGKAQLFFTLTIIGAILFVLFKVVPVYYHASDFSREFEDLCRTAAIRAEDDRKITERFKKIRDEYQVPEDNCKFEINRKTGGLKLKVEYHVPITLIGYTYDWVEKKEITESTNKY